MPTIKIRVNHAQNTFTIAIVYPTHEFPGGKWYTIEQAQRAAARWQAIVKAENVEVER